jgi:hypothetical protein
MTNKCDLATSIIDADTYFSWATTAAMVAFAILLNL